MPSSHHQQPARLTKKQKKATAFRERGSKFKGKGKGEGSNPASGRLRPSSTTGDNGEYEDEDANAVPAMEDQDQALAAMEGDTETDAKGDEGRAARVPKTTVGSTAAQTKGKQDRNKRRRAEDGEVQPRAKKARLARSSKEILPPAAREEDGAVKDGGDGVESKTNGKGSKTQRYILFIGNVLPPQPPSLQPLTKLALVKGNLKYTTTPEAIQNHFSPCGAKFLFFFPFKVSLTRATFPDPPPTIRLLTPKVTHAGTTAAKKSKSKGCAFLEFSTWPALQAALRLHQSELDGRRINVELTAGGGGKSDARLEKVKARNKLLAAQRVRSSLSCVTLRG